MWLKSSTYSYEGVAFSRREQLLFLLFTKRCRLTAYIVRDTIMMFVVIVFIIAEKFYVSERNHVL